jgi:hypothetical protein
VVLYSMLSPEFVRRIKLANEPAYRIANRAAIHPCTLSKLLNGQERIKSGDARVIAIGRVVGLSAEECFAADDSHHAA